MQKIQFSDGSKTSSAKVTIDEVDYPVTPARYTGATPLSSQVLNTMQTNIENAIDQNTDNIGGEEYDETATYEEGDIVKYEGQLYICIEAIDTPEEWDSTKWDATDVLSSAGGNEVTIGTSADITGKTKIFIDESEGTDAYSEVVNSLSGNEIAKAPSVHAVNGASVIVSATEPQGNDRRKVWMQHSDNLLNEIEWQQGSIDGSGTEVSSNNRIRSEYISVQPNTIYSFAGIGSIKVLAFEYTNADVFVKPTFSVFITSFPINFTTSSTTYKLRIILAYNDNSNLTPSAISTIKPSLLSQIDKSFILNSNNEYEEFTPQDEIYSTDEIKIGKWMGKPLYRKCYTGTTGTTDGVDLTISNLDKLVNEGGYIAYTSSLLFPIPSTFGTDGTNDIRVIKTSSSTFKIQYGSNLKSKDYELFVEYTKTTD